MTKPSFLSETCASGSMTGSPSPDGLPVRGASLPVRAPHPVQREGVRSSVRYSRLRAWSNAPVLLAAILRRVARRLVHGAPHAGVAVRIVDSHGALHASAVRDARAHTRPGAQHVAGSREPRGRH